MNFLLSNKRALIFGLRTWAGKQVATHCKRGYERPCRVQLEDDVIILASTRTLVPGVATKPLAMKDWIMEALMRTPGNLPIWASKILI